MTGSTLMRKPARALANLGTLYQQQGRYQQAADHHQQAITLFREIGDQDGEARALNTAGETLRATGRPSHARTQHAAALALASQIGDQYEQARAHDGLAHTHHATGNPSQARQHWHHALTLYTDLTVPDADTVRTHLAALEHTASPDSDK